MTSCGRTRRGLGRPRAASGGAPGATLVGVGAGCRSWRGRWATTSWRPGWGWPVRPSGPWSARARAARCAARPVAWPLTLPGVTPPGAPVSVRLERPGREDVVALGTLIYRAYRGGVDDNGEIEADGIAEARGYFETPGALALRPELSGLARAGDVLLGACLITHWQGWMLAAHLVVDPDWQGHGVGRALLQSSLSVLAGHGVPKA